MQRAWLEYDTGYWFLLMDGKNKGNCRVRSWIDKTAALCELADEGWTLRGSVSRRRRAHVGPKSRFQSYKLSRMVQ